MPVSKWYVNNDQYSVISVSTIVTILYHQSDSVYSTHCCVTSDDWSI